MKHLPNTLHLSFNHRHLNKPQTLRFAQMGADKAIFFDDPSNSIFENMSFLIPKQLVKKKCQRTFVGLCALEKHFSKLKNPYCLSEGLDESTWLSVFGNAEELRLSFFQSRPQSKTIYKATPMKTGAFYLSPKNYRKKDNPAKGSPRSLGLGFYQDFVEIVDALSAINQLIRIRQS